MIVFGRDIMYTRQSFGKLSVNQDFILKLKLCLTLLTAASHQRMIFHILPYLTSSTFSFIFFLGSSFTQKLTCSASIAPTH